MRAVTQGLSALLGHKPKRKRQIAAILQLNGKATEGSRREAEKQ